MLVLLERCNSCVQCLARALPEERSAGPAVVAAVTAVMSLCPAGAAQGWGHLECSGEKLKPVASSGVVLCHLLFNIPTKMGCHCYYPSAVSFTVELSCY